MRGPLWTFRPAIARSKVNAESIDEERKKMSATRTVRLTRNTERQCTIGLFEACFDGRNRIHACSNVMQTPWIKPKIMNCRPAPCHTPAQNIVTMVGNATIAMNPVRVLAALGDTDFPAAMRARPTAIEIGVY